MKRLSLELRIWLLVVLDRVFIPARDEMHRRWLESPEGRAITAEADNKLKIATDFRAYFRSLPTDSEPSG